MDRIDIDQDDLKRAYKELKAKGMSLEKISNKIGTNLKNSLYYNYSMKKTSFDKLESLLGRKIKHKLHDGKQVYKKKIALTQNNDLAEMIGIILLEMILLSMRPN